MFRLFITLLIFLFAVAGVCGAPVKPKPKPKVPAVIKTDTSTVRSGNFDIRKVQGYLKDEAFKYNKNDVDGESPWESFWSWFWRSVNRSLFSSKGANDFWNYFFIVAGICFLIFVVFKIVGINTAFIIRGNSRKVESAYSVTLENIHELNFEEEIEKARSDRNYRLAVRFLYLYSLKQLNDAGLINWQIEKTNSTYLREIPEGENRQLFGLLTRQFEYVWYGNFNIDERSFTDISNLFKQFKQQVR